MQLAPAAHTEAALATSWESIAKPGGWFSGRQRVAIAHEVRAARSCAFCRARKSALSPHAIEGDHALAEPQLGSALVDAIHRITTDPGRLSQRWYDGLLAAGVLPEELIELTSLIGLVTIADTNARALSEPERPLPEPREGEPARRSVAGVRVDRGWVPMVAADRAEGFVKLMYEQVEASAGFVFNVARALTAVPEALRDFFGAFLPNYTTHGPVRPGGLTRSQVEVLSTTTSAYNDCFY